MKRWRVTLVAKNDFAKLLKGCTTSKDTSFAWKRRDFEARLLMAESLLDEALTEMTAYSERLRDEDDHLFPGGDRLLS